MACLLEPNSMLGLPPDDALFGESQTMGAIQTVVEAVSSTAIPLLIRGEVGTGKETLARYVHKISPWGRGTFTKLSAETTQESFDSHPPGTLFLDEVADLPIETQDRLLRTLSKIAPQAKGRVTQPLPATRLVCASSRALQQQADAGLFRRELLGRLNVASLEMPPLRQRRGDILVIARYCLRAFQTLRPGLSLPSLSVTELMENYSWPGNIRELANMMLRYTVLGSETALLNALQSPPQPEGKSTPTDGLSLKEARRQVVQELERRVIKRALENNHGNRKLTAQSLRISYRALLYKMKEAGWPSQSPKVCLE